MRRSVVWNLPFSQCSLLKPMCQCMFAFKLKGFMTWSPIFILNVSQKYFCLFCSCYVVKLDISQLPICHFQLSTSSTCTFCQLAILPTCQMSSCHLKIDVLPTCLFTSIPFCQLVIWSTCQLSILLIWFINLSVHQLAILSTCHFVNLSSHQCTFFQLIIPSNSHQLAICQIAKIASCKIQVN